LTRGLDQSIGPHIQLIQHRDPFLDSDVCGITNTIDPKTGISTTTKKLDDGRTTIEKRDSQGVAGTGPLIATDEYDTKGLLTSSVVWQTNDHDPNSGKAQVYVHKDGKKDITIARADGGSPLKFTMTKSDKIVPSNPKVPVKQYFNNPGNRLSSSTISDTTNGVTVDVYEGGKSAPGWKIIKATKSDNSMLVDVAMNPKGALLLNTQTPSSATPPPATR
jgi:hypothetical protein